MEQANFPVEAGATTSLSRKAWTAYCSVLLTTLLALAVLGGGSWYVSHRLFAAVLPLILVIAAYRCLVIRSHHLYCDDIGVWSAAGVLPWSKGVQGVKWRDLDEAVYFPGFWSWIMRSYTLRIGHRYTKTSEILLTHMAGGKEAVAAINSRHQEMVRRNTLT
jgi:hypothetical protein